MKSTRNSGRHGLAVCILLCVAFVGLGGCATSYQLTRRANPNCQVNSAKLARSGRCDTTAARCPDHLECKSAATLYDAESTLLIGDLNRILRTYDPRLDASQVDVTMLAGCPDSPEPPAEPKKESDLRLEINCDGKDFSHCKVDFGQIRVLVGNLQSDSDNTNSPAARAEASATGPATGATATLAHDQPSRKCVSFPASGTASGTGGRDRSVPEYAAAVIVTAADECLYQTYQRDRRGLQQADIAAYGGAAMIAAGVLGTINHWSSATTSVLGASGVGVSVLDRLSKPATQSLPSTKLAEVITAGLAYFPLIREQARILSGGDSCARCSHCGICPSCATIMKETVNVQSCFDSRALARLMLARLWDAAGSACATGVLKGNDD